MLPFSFPSSLPSVFGLVTNYDPLIFFLVKWALSRTVLVKQQLNRANFTKALCDAEELSGRNIGRSPVAERSFAVGFRDCSGNRKFFNRFKSKNSIDDNLEYMKAHMVLQRKYNATVAHGSIVHLNSLITR